MFRWEFAILEAINSLGGEAGIPEVYAVLTEHFPLSENDQKGDCPRGKSCLSTSGTKPRL